MSSTKDRTVRGERERGVVKGRPLAVILGEFRSDSGLKLQKRPSFLLKEKKNLVPTLLRGQKLK